MQDFIINKVTNILPATGKILIAEPFMLDPDFSRSVIFICNHSNIGTFGLSINKKFDNSLNELLPEFTNCNFPVFIGGPVDNNTLFVVHTKPEILGGEYILNGMYLGADFNVLKKEILNNSLSEKDIKFFIGYSGWQAGQLENELKEEAWLVANAEQNLVFSHNPKEIYKKSLEPLGKSFSTIALLPIHPSLN